MSKFERCLFWFIMSCFLSLVTTHASFTARRKIVNLGCENISLEFTGTNVFDNQAQINKFDVIGNEKNAMNGEEYATIACQKTFEELKHKNFVPEWGITSGIYWVLLSIGFYASENKKETGF